MKSNSRIVAIFVFTFWCLVVCAQASSSPCLGVGSETTCSTSVTTPVNTGSVVPYNLLDPTAGLDAVEDARYKVFWIFGDGNFKFFPDSTKTFDLLSHSINYTYANRGTYNPVVVLSEKKSNTSPPQNPKRVVSAPNPTGQTPTAFTHRMTDVDASMDIFNHEKNRYPYPTAFVVSANAGDKAQIKQIYFFYNSMDANGTSTFSPTAIQSYASSEFPSYFTNTPSVSELNTSDLNANPGQVIFNSAFTTGTTSYRNFLNALMPTTLASATLPAGFDEIRFFPILNTTWNSGTLPQGRYLAVAVGTQPFSSTSDFSYVAQLRMDAAAQFPGIESTTLRITTTGSPSTLYIRGMATLNVDMVGAIDPNILNINRICPLGNDRYQVTMRMGVCNEGFVNAKNFELHLRDFTPKHLLSQPEFIGPDAPVFLGFTAAESKWNYRWDIILNSVPTPNSPTRPKPEEIHDNCREITFTTTTTWEGVQALVNGKGLQLCVFFENAKDDCTFNAPILPPDVVTQEAGHNASDCNEKEPLPTPRPNPTDCDCCRPQYTTVIVLQVTILILVILTVWMLFKSVFPEAYNRMFGKSGKSK